MARSVADAAAARPTPSSTASTGFACLGGSARLEIDGVHLLDEAVVTRRNPDELGRLAVAVPTADEALQQPGPDGVEGIDLADVERDVRCIRDLRGDAVDQAFQHVGMGSRPRRRRRRARAGRPSSCCRARASGTRLTRSWLSGMWLPCATTAHSAAPGSTQPANSPVKPPAGAGRAGYCRLKT